ncbi:uncharacterized protein [Diadema antillarum]|uniref:uncharacterized protein n=1 Tax=Diadema antillarum TaxID=105358 RepID=UPI003A87B1EC
MPGKIPVIDFSAYSLDRNEPDSDRIQSLVNDVHEALKTVGFLYLVNHGIPEATVNSVFSASKRFFEMPEEIKAEYESINVYEGGYDHMGKERCNIERPADLKQSFNYSTKGDISRYLPDQHIPEFRASMESLWKYCVKIHERLLIVIARGLNLKDPEFFVKLYKDIGSENNNSILRSLYYPVVSTVEERQLRCGEHTDYGGITLLFQDSPGLEVRDAEGNWISADLMKGAIVLNIGDLLQRWTADILRATPHRVVHPESSKPRQSIAFFGRPDDESVIECVDGSDKYPPIKADQFYSDRVLPTYSGNDQ